MPDREKSTLPRPLADWTAHGIFRAPYLYLFPAAERAVLRRAGVVLAGQAISGDVADAPVAVAHFRAAIQDARMLSEFLREIAEKAVGTEIPTKAGRRLAQEARRWHVSASHLVSNLDAVFHEATGLAVDEEEPESRARPGAAFPRSKSGWPSVAASSRGWSATGDAAMLGRERRPSGTSSSLPSETGSTVRFGIFGNGNVARGKEGRGCSRAPAVRF